MIAHLESAPAASSDARMHPADAQQLIDKAPLTSGRDNHLEFNGRDLILFLLRSVRLL